MSNYSLQLSKLLKFRLEKGESSHDAKFANVAYPSRVDGNIVLRGETFPGGREEEEDDRAWLYQRQEKSRRKTGRSQNSFSSVSPIVAEDGVN